MTYSLLPTCDLWISVPHLSEFITASFAINLSVQANKDAVIRAISRIHRPPPYTRNSRFPVGVVYIPLEAEWFTLFMRLSTLLSSRDRAANINNTSVDPNRSDNNSLAISKTIEEIQNLRTRRYLFTDRYRFEQEYPWEEPAETYEASRQRQLIDQNEIRFQVLQQQLQDMAQRMSARTPPASLRTNSPPASSLVIPPLTPEDIEFMNTFVRPYPFSDVRRKVAELKRNIVHDIMNNRSSAVRSIPTDAQLRTLAITELDAANSFEPPVVSAPPSTATGTNGTTGVFVGQVLVPSVNLPQYMVDPVKQQVSVGAFPYLPQYYEPSSTAEDSSPSPEKFEKKNLDSTLSPEKPGEKAIGELKLAVPEKPATIAPGLGITSAAAHSFVGTDVDHSYNVRTGPNLAHTAVMTAAPLPATAVNTSLVSAPNIVSTTTAAPNIALTIKQRAKAPK